MKTVTGLFRNDQNVKRLVSALDRHGFVGKDVVRVIDQSKISSQKRVETAQQNSFRELLTESGLAVEKIDLYIENPKQDMTVVVVETEDERASEAISLMRRANASDWVAR